MRLSAQIEFDKTLDLDTDKKSVSVGRSSQCDLVIPSDSISRQHCLIEFQGNQYYITDLESSNGVFINGKKIGPRLKTLIPIGSSLALGTIQCEIKETPREFTASKIVSANYSGDYTATVRVARIDLHQKPVNLELEKSPSKRPRNPITASLQNVEPDKKEFNFPYMTFVIFLIGVLVWYFELYTYLK